MLIVAWLRNETTNRPVIDLGGTTILDESLLKVNRYISFKASRPPLNTEGE